MKNKEKKYGFDENDRLVAVSPKEIAEQEARETKVNIEKNFRNIKICAYPGCNGGNLKQVKMPLGTLAENNQIQYPPESKDPKSHPTCTFCDYHIIFAQKRLVHLVAQKGLVQLFGPFPLIEIVEAVLEAKAELKTTSKRKTKNAKKTKKAKKV